MNLPQEKQLFETLERMIEILVEQNIRLEELTEMLDKQNKPTKKKNEK